MLHRLIFVPARLVQAVPVVLGVTLIVFFMSHLLPGDPALAILGDKATPESVSALRDQLGLDQPIWQQYVHFLSNIVHGDLGTSFTYQRPVTDVVLQAVPVTLTLVALALLLNIVISVPLAGLAAMKPNRTPDLIVRALNMVGQGMPQFWGRHHADPAVRSSSAMVPRRRLWRHAVAALVLPAAASPHARNCIVSHDDS